MSGDYPLCPVCGGRARLYANGQHSRTCGRPDCVTEMRVRAARERWRPTQREEVVADFSGQNIEPGDGGVFRGSRPDRMSYTGSSAAYTMERS